MKPGAKRIIRQRILEIKTDLNAVEEKIKRQGAKSKMHPLVQQADLIKARLQGLKEALDIAEKLEEKNERE